MITPPGERTRDRLGARAILRPMTRAAETLEPSPSTEHEARELTPGQRAEQLADRIKHDARQRPSAYLRETVVPEGGE